MDDSKRERWKDIIESYVMGYSNETGLAPDDAKIPFDALEPLAALDEGWAERAWQYGKTAGRVVECKEHIRREKTNARARARYAARRNLGLRRGPDGWE